jgi:hypothetical protein
LSIGGGLGLYPAKISQSLRFDVITPSGEVSWGIHDQQAKRNLGFGFHGNVAWEYQLNHKLALLAEFQYRLSKMGTFKGNIKTEDKYGNKYEETGTLYYFTEWNYFVATRLSTLEIMEAPPEGGVRWIEDIRKATLDLSGYSIRTGIKIKLF